MPRHCARSLSRFCGRNCSHLATEDAGSYSTHLFTQATLDVIEDEGLLENTRRRGQQLTAGLESIAADHPGVIGEIRGRGLMVGVEFAPESCPGYAGIAGRLSQACLARHMLLLPCGTRQTVRFAPPLVVTEAEVDAALTTFAGALAEVAAGS